MDSSVRWEVGLAVGLFSTVSFAAFDYLHRVRPSPFIDEVFHVPQALKYCQGNFHEWDPKITTLPGLYVISWIVVKGVEILAGRPLCSTYTLRLINVVASSGILYMLYIIMTYNRPSLGSKVGGCERRGWPLWSALNLSLFPVSYCFTFFYYTDTLSTLAFLLMYYFHITKCYSKSAVIGIGSVIIRQTNIIWIGYFLLCMGMPEIKRIILTSDLRQPLKVVRGVWGPLVRLGSEGAGYVAATLLFILFVFFNGGIVVGDRSAHRPVLHLAQIFYFSLFTLVFGFPHFVDKIQKFLVFVKRNLKMCLLALMIGCVIVHKFSPVHPYLLADNRHYSFYVWRRVYARHPLARYLLLPVYAFALYAINSSLDKQIRLPYWLSCSLCLIPQKLLEFRYFILPFILFRLQLKCESRMTLIAESILFISLNIVTCYIYVSKEFYWADSDEVQRIIW